MRRRRLIEERLVHAAVFDLQEQGMKILRHRLHRDDGTPVRFEKSPNTGGALEPVCVVMHYTAGGSAEDSVHWLTDARARASAHLVIERDGAITQLVPFDRVAWHAGESRWEGLEGMNRHSIGVELANFGRLEWKGQQWCAWFGTPCPAERMMEAVHKHESAACGWEIYPQPQIEAALEAVSRIVERYRLRDIVGHEDIAPGRKSDPGPAFPMASFRARILGRARDRAPEFETTTALNIRRGPGTQHEKLVPAPLPTGTRIEVVRDEGSWLLVNVLDEVGGDRDLQGWVHGSYVRRRSP